MSEEKKFICPKFPRSVFIMGTEWQIDILNYDEDPYFEDRNADGYCSNPEKRIVLCEASTFPGQEGENQVFLENLMKHILCHEIVHAFMYESGLGPSSLRPAGGWAKNEEMIDWFAYQGAKVYKAWESCGCLVEVKLDREYIDGKSK